MRPAAEGRGATPSRVIPADSGGSGDGGADLEGLLTQGLQELIPTALLEELAIPQTKPADDAAVAELPLVKIEPHVQITIMLPPDEASRELLAAAAERRRDGGGASPPDAPPDPETQAEPAPTLQVDQPAEMEVSDPPGGQAAGGAGGAGGAGVASAACLFEFRGTGSTFGVCIDLCLSQGRGDRLPGTASRIWVGSGRDLGGIWL